MNQRRIWLTNICVAEDWCDELDQHAQPLAVGDSTGHSTSRSQSLFSETETQATGRPKHDALAKSGNEDHDPAAEQDEPTEAEQDESGDRQSHADAFQQDANHPATSLVRGV